MMQRDAEASLLGSDEMARPPPSLARTVCASTLALRSSPSQALGTFVVVQLLPQRQVPVRSLPPLDSRLSDMQNLLISRCGSRILGSRLIPASKSPLKAQSSSIRVNGFRLQSGHADARPLPHRKNRRKKESRGEELWHSLHL